MPEQPASKPYVGMEIKGLSTTMPQDGIHREKEIDEKGWRLEPDTRHLNGVLEGEVRDVPVRLRRPDGTAVRLGRLWGSCECIAVHAPKRIFTGEEAADFSVRFHTLGMNGEERYTVSAEVLEPVRTRLDVEFRLDVQRVAAKLHLDRDDIPLGHVRGSAEADVRLLNLTRRTVTLSVPDEPVDGVLVTFPDGVRVEAGRAATVRLRYTPPEGTTGPVAGRLVFATSVPEHARMEVPFSGIVPTRKR